jgi:hypothetical protein
MMFNILGMKRFRTYVRIQEYLLLINAHST